VARAADAASAGGRMAEEGSRGARGAARDLAATMRSSRDGGGNAVREIPSLSLSWGDRQDGFLFHTLRLL